MSTSVLEDALNRGFCLEYVDLYKANDLIPQDFQPGTSTTTEQTITDTSTSTTDTSEQTEKTYSEVEIEAVWKETSRTEATCTEAGVIKYKNSITGKTKSEEIPTVDHDYEITEEISATGHTKGDWEVTKEAGAFTNGEKVLKCMVCGEVLETADIPQTSPVSLAAVIAISVATVAGIAVGVLLLRKKTISNKKM